LSREIAESEEKPDASEVIEVLEVEPVPSAKKEISYSSTKKKDKKFKVAAKRAIYEEI
jgi:hypothetical protein